MEFVGRSQLKPKLGIAPLVDIVFLLLIFFMITSTMLKPQGVKVSLPNSSSSKPVAESITTITLKESGELFLDQTLVTRENLPTALAALPDERARKVLLRAESTTAVESLVQILDIIRGSGIQDISLATASSAGLGPNLSTPDQIPGQR